MYVDDILVMSHDPKSSIEYLQGAYKIKDDRIGPPSIYLGANFSKFQVPGNPSGRSYWAIAADTYVKEAVKNLKALLAMEGQTLKTNATTPFPSGYWPELDTSDELDAELVEQYQHLVGIL